MGLGLSGVIGEDDAVDDSDRRAQPDLGSRIDGLPFDR
jgi:hypothetical protein